MKARADIHYVKSASENTSCPAETDTCRSDAYLVPGDLVLANSTAELLRRSVSLQSPLEIDAVIMVGDDTMAQFMRYSAPTYMRVRQQSGLGPQHLREETNIKAE